MRRIIATTYAQMAEATPGCENKDAEPSVDQAISGVGIGLASLGTATFYDWLLRLTTPLDTVSLEDI